MRYCIFLIELKDGRLPTNIDTHLNAWKAEEFQKFAFPAMEVVLRGLIDETEFHIFQLIARMVEMVFNKRDQWDRDDVVLFGKLAKRFNILIEENIGLHASVVTAHNLLHVEEDVFRFSLPDNYWCFAFERAVKKYISIPNNRKNIECSFAKKEQRREFLKSLNTEEEPLPLATKIDVDKVYIISAVSIFIDLFFLIITEIKFSVLDGRQNHN